MRRWLYTDIVGPPPTSTALGSQSLLNPICTPPSPPVPPSMPLRRAGPPRVAGRSSCGGDMTARRLRSAGSGGCRGGVVSKSLPALKSTRPPADSRWLANLQRGYTATDSIQVGGLGASYTGQGPVRRYLDHFSACVMLADCM